MGVLLQTRSEMTMVAFGAQHVTRRKGGTISSRTRQESLAAKDVLQQAPGSPVLFREWGYGAAATELDGKGISLPIDLRMSVTPRLMALPGRDLGVTAADMFWSAGLATVTDGRGRRGADPIDGWSVEHHAASATLAAGWRSCRKATARCAWAAAEKMKRLSFDSTSSQEAR